MNSKLPHAALLGCLTLFCGCAPAEEPGEDPVKGAPYVFVGTVLEPSSTTVDPYPASEETFTVKVDEVIFQKGVFADLTGVDITVVADQRELERGSKYIFYTEPLLFGRSVAVRLVQADRGERPDPEAVREAHERQELDRELRRADLVVQGRVEKVERYKEERMLLTEHWPDLQLATLAIERMLKGDTADGEQIAFLFAASRDVQWYRSPKVEPGDTAVFLLESGGDKALSMQIGAERYTLLEPKDVQPLDRLDTIEELLR